jgi:hypothetical protein
MDTAPMEATAPKEPDVTKFLYCDRCGKEREFKTTKVFSMGGALVACISGCCGVVTGPKLFINYDECISCGLQKLEQNK